MVDTTNTTAAQLSPIAALRQHYLRGEADPVAVLDAALARANSNAGHNVYLAQDAAWSRSEAARLDPARIPGRKPTSLPAQPLWGIPISLKDCFDLAGFPTTCGAGFLRDSPILTSDSTVAARLRAAGAVLTGKTHLHQLAYGITGENAAFGDCLQPRDPATLTGGSSSGAAASVQEGSALAAIGTDTGGSVRAPAALCGLAGYRSSITINTPEVWQGGGHLAPSFDTVGWLYRDLRDGPVLGQALFHLPLAAAPLSPRIGIPDAAFFHDCEPAILATLELWKSTLADRGATLLTFDPALWADATAIIAPIQAHEAAQLHRGHFDLCEPTIAARLAWGAAITKAELATLLARRQAFRAQTYALFDTLDFLLLPCTPMTSLFAGTDHTETRARILRYTSPISLTGLPVVTLPGPAGPTPAGGLQLVGPLNSDATLLALSAALV